MMTMIAEDPNSIEQMLQSLAELLFLRCWEEWIRERWVKLNEN